MEEQDADSRRRVSCHSRRRNRLIVRLPASGHLNITATSTHLDNEHDLNSPIAALLDVAVLATQPNAKLAAAERTRAAPSLGLVRWSCEEIITITTAGR